ncbi:MAG: hypothetical protein D6758_08535 [Gammaproteobacteria bacterium]|nr:MAG: hypothetical protein D6758_08535 [Gammaproteobacteria bacterium]
MRGFLFLLSLHWVGSCLAAASGSEVAIEWRWHPGAWVTAVTEAAWQSAEPVTLPGALASRDLAHRWLGNRPEGPLWGTLIGRFVIPARGDPGEAAGWWLDTGTLAVAASICIDGEEVTHMGRPAADRASEIPRVLPWVVPLGHLAPGAHTIRVRMSGNHFKEVGLWSPARLRSASAGTLPLERWGPALVLLGGLGLSLLYLAGLGVRERRPFVRRVVFWLGVFTGALLLRMLMARQLAELFWSEAPAALARYNVWVAVEFASFFLAMLAWARVLQAFWRRAGMMNGFLVLAQRAALVAVLMAWLTPPYVFTLLGSPMQVLAAGLLLASLRVGAALWRVRPDRRGLWAVSLVALALPAFHDIALTQFWLTGEPWTEWGLMTVTLCVAWFAVRFPEERAIGQSTGAGHLPLLAKTDRDTPENVERPDRRVPDVSDEASRMVADVSGAMTDAGLEARQALVTLLCRALALWEVHTGQSKAALAEASGAWRVYIDGSTAKTRTLDKYLKLSSLPARPRWRQVIRTALYVRQHCDLPQDELRALDQLIEQVEISWAGAPVKPVTIV